MTTQVDEEKTGPILPSGPPETSAPKEEARGGSIPAAVYIAVWISLSSSVILYNKYILDRLNFPYPVFLTTFHLVVSTIITQVLARTTTLLDSRKSVRMNGEIYIKSIVPIGFFFSLSLICGNIAYIYLSVSFIQMLKATTPVLILIAGWMMGMKQLDMKQLINVLVIVVGVIIATAGEVKFVLIGVLIQLSGLIFEVTRLLMIEKLLSSPEFKMDPIVSLYYYAPACAVMNCVVFLFKEAHKISIDDIFNVGIFTLLSNALVAFLLNVSVVLLIKRTSSLVFALSGIVKDILLVVASAVLFRDPVSRVQIFGYGIALAGLIYHKLGGEKLRELGSDGVRHWSEYGLRHPLRRRVITAVISVIVFVLAFMFLSNTSMGEVAVDETTSTASSP